MDFIPNRCENVSDLLTGNLASGHNWYWERLTGASVSELPSHTSDVVDIILYQGGGAGGGGAGG